jgi:hypothetical protein
MFSGELSPVAGRLVSALSVLEMADVFPLALVPHLVAFFNGDKRATRLVLTEHVAESMVELFESLGYQTASTAIGLEYVGATWGELRPMSGGSKSPSRLVVAAASAEDAKLVLNLELNGDSSDAGHALGYPACCVEAYPDLARARAGWGEKLLTRSSTRLTTSMWCNRLASLWGGTCSIGELFPCDLLCAHAIELGRRADQLLRTHGFDLLADEICSQSRRPIYFGNRQIFDDTANTSHAERIRIVD